MGEKTRVLLAGWFSIEGGGATAGDILVRDVLCEWLREERVPYDIAQTPDLGSGVDWFRVSPERYTHFIFVCGPVGPDLAVRELIDRFGSCRRAAINVSLIGDPAWRPFELTIERDSQGRARPDLALTATAAPVPVVAVVRTHHQAEYVGARPDQAHAAFARLLASRQAAVLSVDTVLDLEIPGRRTPGEVQALISRADMVLTTRLHGLVLALARGVPALAVDVVSGGAKVLAQARALAWPAVMTVDDLDELALQRHFDWCLTPEARRQAQASLAIGVVDSKQIRAALVEHLDR
jgi:hypothetical protein